MNYIWKISYIFVRRNFRQMPLRRIPEKKSL